MTRIFTTESFSAGRPFVITGADAVHISRSLRMRPGEALELCGAELECTAVITAFSPDTVTVLPGEPHAHTSEPDYRLTLCVGMPKSDKLELVAQKAVELGVYRIVPFTAERSVSRPDKKSAASRTERLRRIVAEAASQCGRGVIPEVSELLTEEAAFSLIESADIGLFCHEKATLPLSRALCPGKLPPSPAIVAFVGPEGGFSDKEFDKAVKMGYNIVSLGARVLRCETAPMCLLSAVMCVFGEL